MAEEALIFDIDILDYKMRKLEESFETLELQKKSLETQKQSLESQNQSLESQKHSLETSLQIWKLSARGMSADDISIQTGFPKDLILKILSE